MKNILLVFFLTSFSKVVGQNGTVSLVYTNGDVKIEIKTTSENCVFTKNEKNLIMLHTENLDTKMMTFSGKALRFSEEKPQTENELLLEVNLADIEEKKDVYTLRFKYKKNEEFVSGKFEIPIELE